MQNKKIVIVGGGSAGIIAAARLDSQFDVHLYEQGKILGRKFLVAGKGGFNLTNEAVGEALYQRYSELPALQAALRAHDSAAMRQWLADLGVPTYIGSSGRVFPLKGTKPISVLQVLRERLLERGVAVHYRQNWQGFDAQDRLLFENDQGVLQVVEADYYIFALGGASWSITGSNQRWLSNFEKLGIATRPFEASNCGVEVAWPTDFKTRFAGQPLKNIAVRVGTYCLKGEALITDYGLEGNAIYPIVPYLRQALQQQRPAILYIDLKPYNSLQNLQAQQAIAPKQYAHRFKLQKSALALAKLYTDKPTYLDASQFVSSIKNLAIPVENLRPVEEAISTVGGIAAEAVDEYFALKGKPSIFVIGEMLDWDAPTGGFLLQACFSSAAWCADYLKKQLNSNPQL